MATSELKTIGPYEIRGILGRGGMATVYRAYQPTLDREVAVKVMANQFADDPNFMERFRREARSIAKLDHPNILAVYDFGQDGNVPYIVTQLLEGKTLRERLGQPLDPRFAAKINSQMGAALEYAHEQHLIHRDVKPSNVLMDKRDRAVLSDFGIVKLMETDSHLTATGLGVGTPEYMSPEQGMGEGLDGRSDLYSLGVMLYEMLTGVTPFRADTPLAVMMGHVNKPLPNPLQYNPHLTPQMVAVLHKALAKQRDDRFSNVGEFVDAFNHAVYSSGLPPLPTASGAGVSGAAMLGGVIPGTGTQPSVGPKPGFGAMDSTRVAGPGTPQPAHPITPFNAPLPVQPITGPNPALPVYPVTGSNPNMPVHPVTGSNPALPVQPMTGSNPNMPVRPLTGSNPALPVQPMIGFAPPPVRPVTDPFTPPPAQAGEATVAHNFNATPAEATIIATDFKAPSEQRTPQFTPPPVPLTPPPGYQFNQSTGTFTPPTVQHPTPPPPSNRAGVGFAPFNSQQGGRGYGPNQANNTITTPPPPPDYNYGQPTPEKPEKKRGIPLILIGVIVAALVVIVVAAVLLTGGSPSTPTVTATVVAEVPTVAPTTAAVTTVAVTTPAATTAAPVAEPTVTSAPTATSAPAATSTPAPTATAAATSTPAPTATAAATATPGPSLVVLNIGTSRRGDTEIAEPADVTAEFTVGQEIWVFVHADKGRPNLDKLDITVIKDGTAQPVKSVTVGKTSGFNFFSLDKLGVGSYKLEVRYNGNLLDKQPEFKVVAAPTQAPVQTTQAPVQQTTAPIYKTTAPPVRTTAPPVKTTVPPTPCPPGKC